MAGSSTYRSWSSMKSRCNNPNYHKYRIYGARGIKICERWNDFRNFYADMGVKPDGKTLDRIDNDGNYTPENCRWATPKEQSRNNSRNNKITYNGDTLTLTEWSERLEINRTTLSGRYRAGWSVEDILTKEIRKTRRVYATRG